MRDVTDSKNTDKKLESWDFRPEGQKVHFKVEVRSISHFRGGPIIGFKGKFGDGRIFINTDIGELRNECQKYSEEKIGWKFQDVLFIHVDGEWDRDRGEYSDEAEVSVSFNKLRKVRGRRGKTPIYLSPDHGYMSRHNRGVEIPWTQEREDSIRLVLEELRNMKTRIEKIIGSNPKEAASMLDNLSCRMLTAGIEEQPDDQK